MGKNKKYKKAILLSLIESMHRLPTIQERAASWLLENLILREKGEPTRPSRPGGSLPPNSPRSKARARP